MIIGVVWTPEDRAVVAGHNVDPARWRAMFDRELAFYLCWSPTPAALSELVRVAGTHWCVECFQAAKGQVGLDHYQVRHWTSWHRHITLAMLAVVFLAAVAASTTPLRPAESHRPPAGREPILLTVPEIL